MHRHDTSPMRRGIHGVPGGPRCRPSPWLVRRTQLGLSLTQPEAPASTDINASNEAPR
ncbi:3-hydroxybutyryl-CoA dehydrogenase [Paraburkholderia lycopersici]|uniref:3-hydroxybutyryl-CoA dehydrogenase n=1 Tax=Paraburkholderia lycopersici TaxID=416944 RepID=A0A1G6RSE3_9BURK|nr:3-hydroxybutyryl-CoA dehydrogenase [Paraburkholderia lycopersici]